MVTVKQIVDMFLQWTCAVLLLTPYIGPSYAEVNSEIGDPFEFEDFDGLPGVQFEFKVEVGAARSECFYQKIKEGSMLHVSFEVLRGADRNVDMVIKQPNGQLVATHLWTNQGSTDVQVKQEGEYSMCIDNTFSRFSKKLVYFFMVTYLEQEWHEFEANAEEYDMQLDHVQKVYENVTYAVAQIRLSMGLRRKRDSADMYLAETNNQTVQNWSLLMSVMIVLTSAIQAYFVKNMFKTVNVTPTQKPRA